MFEIFHSKMIGQSGINKIADVLRIFATQNSAEVKNENVSKLL